MAQPLVSIIIPCGPRHVEHVRLAAASVAWQSLAPLCETIVACDGGSAVPSLPNVTILPSDGERRGPAHTRNRALAAVRGQFILPLDADDYLHVVTALVPTKHARAVGGWDEGVDAWEDWTFWLRCAIAGVCGYRLPYPIFTYRVYEGDRMMRFYGGAPEHMEAVWKRYRNKQGEILMASCCGGDAPLAGLAAEAVRNVEQAPAALMAGGMVRVQFLGDERGSITWQLSSTRSIRLGNNAMDRYADVSPEEAQWLAERAPIRVVPQFDAPDPPKPLEPIVSDADVLTPDAQALRPRRGRPPNALRPV